MTTAVPPHPLDGLLTIMWQYVREDRARPAVGATWIDAATFDAQLDAISHHRVVVGWADVAAAALEGGPRLP